MGLTFAVPIEAENLEIEFQCGVYNEYKDFNKNSHLLSMDRLGGLEKV